MTRIQFSKEEVEKLKSLGFYKIFDWAYRYNELDESGSGNVANYYEYWIGASGNRYYLRYQLLKDYTETTKNIIKGLKNWKIKFKKIGLKITFLSGPRNIFINVESNDENEKFIFNAGYKYSEKKGIYYKQEIRNLLKFAFFISINGKGDFELSIGSNTDDISNIKNSYLENEKGRLLLFRIFVTIKEPKRRKSEQEKEESKKKTEYNSWYDSWYEKWNKTKTETRTYDISWWKDMEFTSMPTDFKTVKRKYIELTKRYHPDIIGKSGEEKMKKLNRAYELAKKYFGR